RNGNSTPIAAMTQPATRARSRTAKPPARSSACRRAPIPRSRRNGPSAKRAILLSATWAASTAWRKFEPERFSDAEVEAFKKEWRAAHPAIKKFWYDVDRAACKAVRERGQVVRCGRIVFKCAGAFLFLKLPSGRKLAYPYPRIIGAEREQHVV